MNCCPCCCENEKLSIYCKTCGQNVCKHCFLTCRKCYDRFCIDCEDRDFLCVDCLGDEEKLFRKLKQADNVLNRCDKVAEDTEEEEEEDDTGSVDEDDTGSVDEDDEVVDYSLYKPRELCYVIEDLKYKLNASEELTKEKDKQMEILREKIGLLEEQNKLLKEQLNKKLN
jgi:hypothetical protein